MKRVSAAILCLFLAAAPVAVAGPGFEGLPEGDRPEPVEFLPAADGPTPDLFLYRADPGAEPTIRPDPPLVFVPPAPFDGERPGWFLDAVGVVATNALADFRLRPPGAPDLPPAPDSPPRTEVVPEPASLLLVLAGFLCLLLFTRRRAAAR